MSGILLAMRRSWGGLERLLAGLPEGERAGVYAKLAVTHDELLRRADEAAARESMAVGSATRDPAVLATAAQLLRAAGWTCEPPD